LKLLALSGLSGAILIVARGAILTMTPDRFRQTHHQSTLGVAKTGVTINSLSDSFAAAPADRFMHAPQLKKWTAIIDHHSGVNIWRV
jgi:hypothetical protein